MTPKASLLAARNADGGWPYYAGKTSRLEPTVWALLALHADGERVTVDPLLNWPRRDGWFVDRSGHTVNICINALVAFGLATLNPGAADAGPLVAALVDAKGVKLPQSPSNVQDNSIQGWPWTDGTFSWVEPTAMAVIALRRYRSLSGVSARIADGQRLLLDRACLVGGWNYGNAHVLGRQLEPHTPPTALALLALIDREDTDGVTRGRQYLRDHRLEERSGLALALTRIALSASGAAPDDVSEALEQQWGASAFLGNLHVTALALYSEAAASSGYEAFRV